MTRPRLLDLFAGAGGAAKGYQRAGFVTYEELQAENARLREKGTPGVMHEVDEAFYRLAVKERDLQRVKADLLEAENAQLRQTIREIQKVVAKAIDALASEQA